MSARWTAMLVLMLFSPAGGATDCIKSDADHRIELRGGVESNSVQTSSELSKFRLHLSAPVCLQGFNLHREPYRRDGVSMIQLAISPVVEKHLRDGEAVTLLGHVEGPTADDPDAIYFVVREILRTSLD